MSAESQPDQMHRSSERTRGSVDHVLSYVRKRALWANVPLDKALSAEQIAALVPPTITASGLGAERAATLFEDVIAPTCLSTDHPGYLAFIPSAPSKAAIAFDLVVSASAIFGGSWVEGAGAVYAENEVLAFLSREFGLPDSAGGVFVQGGTLGNLSALVAARAAARRRNSLEGRPDPDRWVIVCSEEAHSSVQAAADVMDVDVVGVPVGADGRLYGDAVTAALASHGDAVFAVVATAGTTNFGIVDDIAGVAAAARDAGVWLHVDGAYGLAAALVPSMKAAFAGVELADSVIVDPHKWLFAPFDVCALIYRDPENGRLAHTQHAEYLEALTMRPEWNPSDYAIHLTRRPRGLPLWYSLAVHGVDQYRQSIAYGLELAQRIAAEIAARPGLSLVRDPQLSIVVFRRDGWGIAEYEAWSEKLLTDQIGFVVPSWHAGEPVLRFAIINPLTTFELLRQILDTLV